MLDSNKWKPLSLKETKQDSNRIAILTKGLLSWIESHQILLEDDEGLRFDVSFKLGFIYPEFTTSGKYVLTNSVVKEVLASDIISQVIGL